MICFRIHRGKQLLGYTDSELSNKGGYDLVHYDDLAYVASAHQECTYFKNINLKIFKKNSLYLYEE